MLRGIETDPNPMLTNPAEGRELNVVYEDDHLLLINKPEEFLSVPGKNITDSVYTRIRELYPDASGPLIVHRLDMSTSGLLLIAKSEMIYKTLQRQFLKRTVKKRYVAILKGVPKEQSC
jgi:tRNA pseudouridine32 synthase/23S rRNA pseudouridine746 synthase